MAFNFFIMQIVVSFNMVFSLPHPDVNVNADFKIIIGGDGLGQDPGNSNGANPGDILSNLFGGHGGANNGDKPNSVSSDIGDAEGGGSDSGILGDVESGVEDGADDVESGLEDAVEGGDGGGLLGDVESGVEDGADDVASDLEDGADDVASDLEDGADDVASDLEDVVEGGDVGGLLGDLADIPWRVLRCDCNYNSRTPGCMISRAAPKNWACKCTIWKGMYCNGKIVQCIDKDNHHCKNPDTSIHSCVQATLSNCLGY